ncbi:MAG TPA: hypothetical protein VM432_00610, partial [Bdellovibrionales bacterium]|nr:hypothetical protein [Bdellovibrionales bacterium]
YALEVLPPSSRGLVEFYVKSVLQNMRLVSADLLPIDDSFEVMVPQGCKAEQLANYYSDDKIFINGPIWKMLTETGRAAIIVHEAVYAANRAVGATNSRQSRYVVAHLFASDTKLTDIKDRLPENALTCVGSKAPLFVWAFKNDGEWTLQFQILGGAYVVSKKTFTVSDEDFDLMEAKTFPVIPGEEMIGTSSEEVGSVESDFESKDIMTIRKTWEPIKTSDGKVIKGLQTPRYYLSWRSGTHPKTEVRDQMLNCSVGMP